MNTTNDVLAIEERAINAWPALQTIMVGGWALRMSGGFTKRANSVNALSPRGSFDKVRIAAEAVFASNGLPTIFRISPLAPPEADIALEAQGYSHFDPSLFMTAPLEGILCASNAEIDLVPSVEWLDGFASANGVTGGHAPVTRCHCARYRFASGLCHNPGWRKASGLLALVCLSADLLDYLISWLFQKREDVGSGAS